MRDRIVKICDSFMGQRFDLPPTSAMKSKIMDVRKSISESKALTETSRK